MSQADYQYDTAELAQDAAGLPLSVSIFVDRGHVRDALRDDALAAGMRLGQIGELELLLDNSARALSDVVLIDCPVVSAELMAALAQLDTRAASTGTQLIVSTSVEGLDDVFGCLDTANPQILVDPTRGDRVIALGQILTMIPGMRLREMTETDRVTMLRLTEQVAQIAERLERMDSRGLSAGGGAFRFETPKPDFNGKDDDAEKRLVRAPRPPLPDPRLVRKIIAQRQLRARFFDGELFADPAWDILLDLTAARAEHERVSVTSLCIASAVPPTTALRWITQMVEAGLLERVEDEEDRRRAFIALSDQAADGIARYFAELGKEAVLLA